MKNGLEQHITVEESTSIQWVNQARSSTMERVFNSQQAHNVAAVSYCRTRLQPTKSLFPTLPPRSLPYPSFSIFLTFLRLCDLTVCFKTMITNNHNSNQFGVKTSIVCFENYIILRPAGHLSFASKLFGCCCCCIVVLRLR